MFSLDEVVPWGRSFDEYRRMFALSDDDLASSVVAAATVLPVSTRRQRAAVSASSPAIRSIAGELVTSVSASPRPPGRSSKKRGATRINLFLYSAQLDERAHVEALTEMCRVATEVRVFPLVSLSGDRSPHLQGTSTALREAGYAVSFEVVPYEFQRGGNEMMRIRRGA